PDDDGIVRVVAGPGRVLRMSFGNLRYGSMVDLVDARTGAMDFEVVASQRFVVGLPPQICLVGVRGTSWIAGYSASCGGIAPVAGWLFVDREALGADDFVVVTPSGWGAIPAAQLVGGSVNWGVIDHDWLHLTVTASGVCEASPRELLLLGPERRDK